MGQKSLKPVLSCRLLGLTVQLDVLHHAVTLKDLPAAAATLAFDLIDGWNTSIAATIGHIHQLWRNGN
jgi:hypothetical protein